MILINLLPPELRRDTLRQEPLWQNPKLLKTVGGLALVLTLVFYVHYWFGHRQLKKLEAQWVEIQQDLDRVSQLKSEMEAGVKAERSFLESYVISPLQITTILSAASDLLPGSIWLLELKLIRQADDYTVFLKGISRPSREESSVHQIESYLRDLKLRFPEHTELVLTTSRQQRERLELTLFTAVFKW